MVRKHSHQKQIIYHRIAHLLYTNPKLSICDNKHIVLGELMGQLLIQINDCGITARCI